MIQSLQFSTHSKFNPYFLPVYELLETDIGRFLKLTFLCESLLLLILHTWQ